MGIGQVLPVYIQGHSEAPIKLLMDNVGSQSITTIGVSGPYVEFSGRANNLTDYLNNRKALQVEGLTLANGATITADAAASGGSKARVPAAEPTIGNLVERASATLTTQLDALRGVFRVYLRHKSTAGAQGDTNVFQLKWGRSSGTQTHLNSAVTKVLNPDLFQLTDLGPIAVEDNAAGLYLSLFAQRSTGLGTIDLDYLAFVPADEYLGEITHTNTGAGGYVLLDGETGRCSLLDANEKYLETAATAGTLPRYLKPGLNLLWINRRLPDTDLTGSSFVCRVTYSPRSKG